MIALLAHMTKEQSDEIGRLMLMLGIAALTVLALLIWGLVALIRFLCRGEGSGGEVRQPPSTRLQQPEAISDTEQAKQSDD